MKKEYIKPTSCIHLYLSQVVMDINFDVSKQGNSGDDAESKGTSGGGIDWDAFDNDTEE